MATSGSNTSSWNNFLHLDLAWSRVETDVAGNRSKIRLTLSLRHTGSGIWFSASKSGVLHGQAFTYTGGFSGSGTRVLRTRDIWVGHNADGTKTQTFTASFNPAITLAGAHAGNRSVSVTGTIDQIPRASELTAFSFAGTITNGAARAINYTVSRKSDSFRHQVQLRDGSTVLQTWDNQNTNGASTVTMSASTVNTLLNRMSNVTSRSLTLRVATRSGVNGGWIGSAVTRTATVNIHSGVRPTATNLSISQVGNTVTSGYLQSISKVKASFTRSAGYGASIVSSRITVSRSGDSQTINSNDGTTSRVISGSGTYTVTAVATDSRGRTNTTLSTTFTATAYSFPTISNFSAVRKEDAQATVAITSSGNFTALGSSNRLTVSIQKRSGGGAWINAGNNVTKTGGSFTENRDNEGNSVTSSYTFRLTITDSFDNGATSEVSVPTQRVVLDIYRDEGVGIGKMYEPNHGSALQVADALIDDIKYHTEGHDTNLNDLTKGGSYHIGANAENIPLARWGYLTVVGDEYNCVQYYTTRDVSPSTFVRSFNHARWGWSNWEFISGNFFIPATLLNGWYNYSGTYREVGYWKDGMNTVHLEGLARISSTTNSGVILQLPLEYRPSDGQSIFAVLNDGLSGRVDVQSNGNVFFPGTLKTGSWVSLSGISFRTQGGY